MKNAMPEVRPMPEQSLPLLVEVYTTLDRSEVVKVERQYDDYIGTPNAWVDISASGEWVDIPMVNRIDYNVRDFIRKTIYTGHDFRSSILLRRNDTDEVLWHTGYEGINSTMLLLSVNGKGLPIKSTFYLTDDMGEVEAVDTEAFSYTVQHEYAEMWQKGMYQRKPISHEYCADLKGRVYTGRNYPIKIDTQGCRGDLIKCVRNYLDKKPIYTWYEGDPTFEVEGDRHSLLMVVVNDGEFYRNCDISSLVGNLKNRSQYADWFNIYLTLSKRVSRELLPAINRCYNTKYKSLHDALKVNVLAPKLHDLTLAILAYYEK